MLWSEQVYLLLFSEQKCWASPQCHFSFFLSSAPWRLPQRRSLQRALQEGFSGLLRKSLSFSIEQSSNHVFELCLRPFAPLSENASCEFRVVGEMLEHFLRISADIGAFFSRQSLGFKLLAHKCHEIEISSGSVDSRFEGGGKKEEETRGRETFVRAVRCFYATDTGEMGNALFAVGWDFAFADNFHTLEFCAFKWAWTT